MSQGGTPFGACFSQDVRHLSRRVFPNLARVCTSINGSSGCANIVAPLVVGVLSMRAAVTVALSASNVF